MDAAGSEDRHLDADPEADLRALLLGLHHKSDSQLELLRNYLQGSSAPSSWQPSPPTGCPAPALGSASGQGDDGATAAPLPPAPPAPPPPPPAAAPLAAHVPVAATAALTSSVETNGGSEGLAALRGDGHDLRRQFARTRRAMSRSKSSRTGSAFFGTMEFGGVGTPFSDQSMSGQASSSTLDARPPPSDHKMAIMRSLESLHWIEDESSESSDRVGPRVSRMDTEYIKKVEGTRSVKYILRRVWKFLEDSSSSPLAACYAYFVTALILCCTATAWLELVSTETMGSSVQAVLEVFFLFELTLRYASCPNRNVFWFDLYNLLDLLVVLQIAFRIVLNATKMIDAEVTLWIRIFIPTLMLLKLLRRFETFHLLISAFSNAFEALPVLLYTLFLIALGFAGLVYAVELQGTIASPTEALWLTVVTMSTVGYGDVVPSTPGGKVVMGGLTVVSGLYMAIPIGIVGNAFSKVWEDRERLLILKKLRDRIIRAGYTPQDLHEIFQQLDSNEDFMLSFEEFREILPMMKVQMSDELAVKVFREFDKMEEGSIDFHDFLLGIFPASRYFQQQKKLSLMVRGQSWHSKVEAEKQEPQEVFQEPAGYDFEENASETEGTVAELNEQTTALQLRTSVKKGHADVYLIDPLCKARV